MASSVINGATQVARWFECNDGRYCLELIIAGTPKLITRNYFARDQVQGLRPELEVRGLEEAQKLWPHAQ